MVKKHKRFLPLLIVPVLTLSLIAGCGTTDSSADSSGSSASVTDVSPISVTYSTEDTDSSWDASNATNITLNGDSITVSGSGASSSGSVLTIQNSGTYVISGTISDGQVVVSAGEEDIVRIVLNGASVTSSDNAAIYARQAKKVILTLAASGNTIEDGSAYTGTSDDEPNAAIFSKGNLTINGAGSLTVKGNHKNGIATKDDLVITGGDITVDAVNDGLRGRDSIAISSGIFNITAGGDALQSNNDEDTSKGWVSIDGGSFTIAAGNDGLQAETILQVTNGNIAMKTGGGSANTVTKNKEQAQPGGSRQDPAQASVSTTEEDSASAKGLKAKTGILITGGVFSIDSSDDSIHANGAVKIQDGEFAISSGDDGIHADSALMVNGGTIKISKSYEGLESANITVTNGTIHVKASDDGLNAAGGNDGSSQNGRPGQNTISTDSSYFIKIAGGYISIDSGGDGIDSNGAVYISGGTILVNGPTNDGNGPLDYDGTCEVSGGILAMAGSSGMAQAPGSTSAQNSLLVKFTAKQEAGTMVTLTDDSGNPIMAFAPSKAYQSIVISSPDMMQGKTYTLSTGGTSSTQLVDGMLTGGTVSGSTKLTDITISGNVTSIDENGSPVSSGMGGPGQGGQPR